MISEFDPKVLKQEFDPKLGFRNLTQNSEILRMNPIVLKLLLALNGFYQLRIELSYYVSNTYLYHTLFTLIKVLTRI